MIFGAESQVMKDNVDRRCTSCKSHVTLFTCNSPLTQLRPEASNYDYWASCDNKDCSNHYGEGFYSGSDKPEWTYRNE